MPTGQRSLLRYTEHLGPSIVVHAKDFTSTEGAGDNNLEPQQREPESLTSDNDEDVGWPVFSDGE